MKNIDETINYLIKEIKLTGLMSTKHKKVFTVLNYIEHLLILASNVTECVSVSIFASLVGIPVGNPGDFNRETNFLHKLLLTNRQVLRLRKTFANKPSSNIKWSKTKLSKIVQLGGFIGRIFGPLLKACLTLMKNLLKPLIKSFNTIRINSSISSRCRNTWKTLGLGVCLLDLAKQTTSVILNKEMDDIMKIFKSLRDSGLLIKGVSKTIKNETHEQKGEFLSMLLGTLGATLLGYLLTDKEVKTKILRRGVLRADEGAIATS